MLHKQFDTKEPHIRPTEIVFREKDKGRGKFVTANYTA